MDCVSDSGELLWHRTRTMGAKPQGATMSAFQLCGLPYEPFAKLFGLPDGELAKLGIRRVVADANVGFP
jgi:hypothetical protein